MKAFTSFLAVLLLAWPAAAQSSFARAVIGAAGTTVAVGNEFTLSFTLGEILVSTVSLPGCTITQGFQQPCCTWCCEIVPVKEPHFEVNFRVYPNPAGEQATLELEFDRAAALNLSLYRADGTLVHSDKLEFSGFYSKVLDLYELPPGIYFLQLYDTERHAFAVESLAVIH